MADNLIFPIGFDLDKAVADASKEWDSTYAAKLEKALAKKPVSVKLKLDTKNLDSLDAVKKRLAELKIEPITPETKTAIKELAGELRTLAKALEQVQKYSVARVSASTDAVRASKIRVNEERAQAQAALAAQRTAKAEENLAAARLKAARAANAHATATRNANKAFGEQSTYLDHLIKRMAVYWSVAQVGNFLTNVREVTAQFELQRVSLGAIIQDQQRANQLFEEIKTFALKSPVKILDLTKYTKQLAAYKIGVDELFETTKRLTDVSVGLGVSMDRVVLAYGQTRATGYLRASEIRQFTEMGVPIVEELASKLSKMNGELVTAAQVMDMVSKRGISFELVKEVFDDMTSAGGMFYNMQEKQGNTLFGLWAKLGDAASVMYDQIGNTDSVNRGMKDAIAMLTSMMRNWQTVARGIGGAAVMLAAFTIRKKILAVETVKLTAIQQTYNARLMQANALAASNSALVRAQGVAMGVYAQSMRFASTMAAAFGTSLRAIKSALVTTGIGALAVALGYLVDRLFLTKSAAEKAKEAIDNISAETTHEQSKSVRNFEYLANKAVEAAAGSKEQQEALEELQRTYKDILPQQVLEIGYLEKLKGNYDSLTATIRTYVAERQRQKAVDEIADIYGTKKRGYEIQITDFFRESGLSEQEIARFWEKFYSIAGDKSKTLGDAVKESLKSAGFNDWKSDVISSYLLSNQSSWFNALNKKSFDTLGIGVTGAVDNIDMLRDAILEEGQALEQNEERTKAHIEATNVFAEAQEKLANELKKVTFTYADGSAVERGTDIWNQMFKNFEIKGMTDILKDGFKQAGLAWNEQYGNFIDKVNAKTPELISSLNFKAITDALINALNNPNLADAQRNYLTQLLTLAQTSQKRYYEIMPSDPIVQTWQARFRQIANTLGGFSKEYNRYLMNNGESLKDYNKRLNDELKDLKDKVKSLISTQALVAKAGMFAKLIYGTNADEMQAQIDAANKQIELIEKLLKEQPDFSTSRRSRGGTKSDPRLGILQEMVSTLKQVNKEYDDLQKKEGSTKALKDTQKVYEATFKNMQKLAQQYKFKLPDFGVPTDTASLTKYLEAIKKAMAKLPKSQKAVLALQVDIDKLNIDEKQKQIEEELKRLADRISRTKTAQEFYDKILSTTGDIDLAASVTMSIYGDAGTDVQGQMAEYISQLFGGVELEVPVSIITSEGVIDYTALEKFATENKKILGDNYKELLKIAQDGQKNMAKTYEGYLKDLEVAKTYADKRIELARYTANQINEIERERVEAQKKLDELVASGKTDKDTQSEIKRLEAKIKAYAELPKQYEERESREAAKLEYEAFKDTPLYTQMFEDLDYASTSALTRMRDRLVALKDQWKNLDPTQLKELQKRLEEIDSQLAARNPFKALADAYKQWRDLRKSGRTKEGDEVAAVNAEKERKAAWDKMMADQKAYELAVKTHGEKSKEAQAAREAADASKEAYENAEKASNKAARQANEWKQIADKARKAATVIGSYTEKINEAAEGIRGMLDAFGASDEDKQFFEDIVGGFNKISKGGQQAAESFARFSSGDIFGGVTAGVGAIGNIVSGFSDLFSAGRVRKANKEIKRQQELLEQLQYTYSRLEYAADKAFGREYISNYQQQIKNLQAQQSAYLKQAQAERSKGKKEDKEKTKQFEEQARETADRIKEMQDELVAHFTGSSKTDIARQMAKSWIEARASMSDTFAAIKGDYQDLIKNMIVEGAAARVIENALTPVWNSMQKMLEKNDVQGAIDSLVNGMDTALNAANNGMEVLWKALEARGYDMKKMLGTSDAEMTGIAKSVAGATSEEINNVAAIGNTLMYYVSPIPRMDENLAAIRALLETGGSVAVPEGKATGWTDWQQQAMDNYNAIARNTAETVAECRRSAQACESIAAQFSRIIKVKGSITGVNTFLNS